MVTPNDIIYLALKTAGVLGVGQSPTAEDVNDSFTVLNFMMKQWNRKRWLVYHLIDEFVACTGQQFYTIGPGGDINLTQRPDRIEASFCRQVNIPNPNQIDYPLEIVEARETYNKIAIKKLGSFPSYLFYDSGYPLGTLYPWPLPNNIYELHISIKEILPTFTSLTQTIALPDEYYAAILYNLTARLRAHFRMPPDPSIIGLAKDALSVIRGANAQIPRLSIPADLLRNGIYNWFSDTIY